MRWRFGLGSVSSEHSNQFYNVKIVLSVSLFLSHLILIGGLIRCISTKTVRCGSSFHTYARIFGTSCGDVSKYKIEMDKKVVSMRGPTAPKYFHQINFVCKSQSYFFSWCIFLVLYIFLVEETEYMSIFKSTTGLWSLRDASSSYQKSSIFIFILQAVVFSVCFCATSCNAWLLHQIFWVFGRRRIWRSR